MGLMQVNYDDAVEPKCVEADEEYQLRITSAKVSENKNGNPYLMVFFEVKDEPTAKELSHYFELPNGEMNEKRLNQAKWGLKNFFQAIDFDGSREFDPADDLPGCECWAILGLREDEQYGEQNFVKKFLVAK